MPAFDLGFCQRENHIPEVDVLQHAHGKAAAILAEEVHATKQFQDQGTCNDNAQKSKEKQDPGLGRL